MSFGPPMSEGEKLHDVFAEYKWLVEINHSGPPRAVLLFALMNSIRQNCLPINIRINQIPKRVIPENCSIYGIGGFSMPKQLIKRFYLMLDLTEPLLGSAPSDPDIYTSYIASKKATLEVEHEGL
jgi:hypothetical protein